MTDRYITKEELIQLLDDAIESEIAKPTEETDMEFVTECEHLINMLMGNEHVYTDKDADRYFKEITKKRETKKIPLFIRSKGFLAASIAVFIFFLSGITLYAFNPAVRETILKTLDLNIGASINDVGITYKYMGRSVKYESIEELMNAEKITIHYPKELPDGVSIENIYSTEKRDVTTVLYTDPTIGVFITHNVKSDKLPDGEEYSVNNRRYIISDNQDRYEAYTIIDNDLYSVRSTDRDILFMLINSLE